jgi:hypothetical protein
MQSTTDQAIAFGKHNASLDFPQGIELSVDLEEALEVAQADVLIAIGVYPTRFMVTSAFDGTPRDHVDLFVDMLTLGIPPGVPLTYQWRLNLPDGSRITGPETDVDWIDTRYDWRLFESDEVRLHAYVGSEEFNQQAVDLAQETIDNLQARFDAPQRPEPLQVWLYDSQAAISGALSPNSRDWIGGVSYAQFSLIAATVSPGNDWSLDRVLPHEVAHQIIYDATANPFVYPATWLDEGIATSVQRSDLEGMDELVENAWRQNRLPSAASLVSEFGSDRAETSIAYASSYSIVLFIESRWGREAVDELVATYREGKSHDETLSDVLGLTTIDLDHEWRRYLADVYGD